MRRYREPATGTELTERQWRAWQIILTYTRRQGPCFTYEAIMGFWSRYRDVRIKFATMERLIRKLADMGLLERRQRDGRRVFCLPEKVKIYYDIE